jgi:hypothetical protein
VQDRRGSHERYRVAVRQREEVATLGTSAILHWLISQSLFLVGIEAYDERFVRAPGREGHTWDDKQPRSPNYNYQQSAYQTRASSGSSRQGTPYRYAIPLMGTSAILHWLISQSLFLVGIEAYDERFVRLQLPAICIPDASFIRLIPTRHANINTQTAIALTSYFLSLPYRYAIPLMGTSAILHWLISQSLFLVGIEVHSAARVMVVITPLKTKYRAEKMSCGVLAMIVLPTMSCTSAGQ